MEMTTTVETRHVYRLPAARVAALLNLGMVPDLPLYVEQLVPFERESAPVDLLGRYAWYAVGDPFHPGGLMACEVRFDAGFGRWIMDISEIRGDRRNVYRLLMHAKRIAREMKFILTGELDIENYGMRLFVDRVFRSENDGKIAPVRRVRYAWEFK